MIINCKRRAKQNLHAFLGTLPQYFFRTPQCKKYGLPLSHPLFAVGNSKYKLTYKSHFTVVLGYLRHITLRVIFVCGLTA